MFECSAKPANPAGERMVSPVTGAPVHTAEAAARSVHFLWSADSPDTNPVDNVRINSGQEKKRNSGSLLVDGSIELLTPR